MKDRSLIVPDDPGSETLRVPVLKVFDGDGFLTRITNPLRRTEFEVGVRFGFIDAPEMEQPGGPEARNFLQSLIGNQWLDIALLMKMDTGKIVDRHRRIVCVPYLTQLYRDENFVTWPRTSPWGYSSASTSQITRNIELEMVVNGWAWVLDRYSPDDRYFDALEDAQKHRRGIWAFENNIHPWQFKKQTYEKRKSARRPLPEISLFDSANDQVSCPANGCNGHLVKRTGRFGPFEGCSNFPRCKYSRSIS